jgi:hypothetical protein
VVPKITSHWWLATLYCTCIADAVHSDDQEQTSGSQVTAGEPAQWLVLLLAAGLGLVGGAVLSFAQWLTMRHKVQGASTWIPANMLAWMVGMPIIFWGIDIAQKLGEMIWIILYMAAVLLLTGLIVGAIHGAFLVRLAERSKLNTSQTGSIISPS